MKSEKKVGIKELFGINKPINENVRPGQTGSTFDIVKLSVYDLEPHPNNKYSVADIQDLKDSIELMDGIEQNLIVKKNDSANKYTVIAGHRRRLASMALVEEGKKQFELVPCRIKTNLDSVRERILLIHTNSTSRILSDWEKTEQLRELKELFTEYKKEHNLPGRIQELLAETLNISPSQVGRYERIDAKLSPEYKEEFKNGNVNFSTAAELARLSPTDQKAVYERHQEKGSTKLKDVKKVKHPKDELFIDSSQATIAAVKKIKSLLEGQLNMASLSRVKELKIKTEEKTEITERMRILMLLIKAVEKEAFEVLGGNIFEGK